LLAAQGSVLVILAVHIDRFTSRYIGKCLEPYRHIALVPLVSNLSHLSISILTAKSLCNLFFKHNLTLKEACYILMAYKLAAWTLHRFILHFLKKRRRQVR
jgi:hypothetical protein